MQQFPTDPSEPRLVTRFRMMPNDLNPDGNVYGARLADHIDTAATDAAFWVHGTGTVTTKNLEISYDEPVHQGDFVSTWAVIKAIGNTSIQIGVDVVVERRVKSDRGGAWELKTFTAATAHAVFVALDENGVKTLVDRKGTDRRFRR